MPPKTTTSYNWVRSVVTENTLEDFVKTGYLPKKSVMSYRVPKPIEEKPQPKEGEVIVFTDHMNRGFSPPDSKFFRDVLHFFNLHPQDICNAPRPTLQKTSSYSEFRRVIYFLFVAFHHVITPLISQTN